MGLTTNILLLLFLLHVSSTTTSGATLKPPQEILNAAETLSNSGYNAMSLTLQSILTDSSLLHLTRFAPEAIQTAGGGGASTASAVTTNTSTGATTATSGGRGRATTTTDGNGGSHMTLTIFTPPDSAFVASGQPSLSQLLLHFVPLSLSLSSLSSLPYGTKIHTLSNSASPLVITSAPGNSRVEINEVAVLGSPIYDDGFVVVFGVEDFFKLNFTIEGTTQNVRSTTLECSDLSPFSTLMDAVGKLKSRGYSIMASFLELQVMGYLKLSPWPLKLTMFAPEDEVLLRFLGDIPSYSGLFLRHMLACKLSFADLNGVENGTVFRDNFEGLSIVIERSDRDFFVNGVEITSPDLYYSDWIAIHGIRDTISEQPDEGIEDEELEEEEDEDDEHSVSYNEEALGPDANEL
ncbi:hypothetical protein LIER_25526 [Lithospermum erythrorhizon]|uniref:FAS1 domain-containing protein n=1 Tax=Lithospermum erythrorhizon TaxID=34254 RepID=A0AAV3R8F5_LITER